jgi:hypothetical protein
MVFYCGISIGAACGGSGGNDPPGPASIQLSVPNPSLVPGEAIQLSWEVKDGQGMTLPNEPVTFSSSNSTILTITNTGLITGVGPGTASVSAKAGSATGQLALVVAEGGVVTPAGGTITGFGGGVELTIPAGAVAAPTPIRLATAPNPLLDPTEVVGSVYSIGPSTVALSVPATLRVRFNPAGAPVGLPVADLRLRRYDGTSWIELPGGATDGASSRAEAALSAGGLVSVGWVVPAAPCTSAEHRQFDFWLGSWAVTENGQSAGLSDITLVPGGCAILEHFRSAGVGRSISFYQPTTNKWYQTYVDDAGNRVLLGGRFQNGGMDLLTPVTGGTTHGRTRWTAEGPNVRQQVAALSTNGGASYGQPQYNFLYVPR